MADETSGRRWCQKTAAESKAQKDTDLIWVKACLRCSGHQQRPWRCGLCPAIPSLHARCSFPRTDRSALRLHCSLHDSPLFTLLFPHPTHTQFIKRVCDEHYIPQTVAVKIYLKYVLSSARPHQDWHTRVYSTLEGLTFSLLGGKKGSL